MLQVFYLDVVVTIHTCCKRMFVNVSSVLDVCCSKCFILHDHARGTNRGGPLGRSGPRVREGSKVGVVAPICMRRRMRTAVAGGPGRQVQQ
jgi:hypothetical protein